MMSLEPTRSQRAHETAERTGLFQYGLSPTDVDEVESKIRNSQSRFVCHIGKLTVHRLILGDQEVYCAYDPKISTIGFFIRDGLGRRMHQRVSQKHSPLRLPSQAH